ncbi:hypothetical protein GALMADRAFT_153851 [Galerina marginata CBS 339.88]|uniref:Uncharacterized protein n=1 Tax=Galerina marginata (strain CBS 339.88) TaxID=685588 RepID=A0A067TAJ9_GALM3|nr:hypothetical protein GALMADRAFT_153851 [Galerina marginata CBS 339.88]
MNATDFGILHLLEAHNEKLEGLKELDGMKYLNQMEQDFYVDLLSKFRRTSQELREFVPNVYNASQPINKLPVEILTTTFNMVQDSLVRAFPPSRDGLETYGLNRWLMVTLVCQHWRHASLSTASLWSNIIMGPDLHDYEGLQQCKRGLCIIADLRHRFIGTSISRSMILKAAMLLFQANLHRMRSIVIRSSAKSFESAIHLGADLLQILCTGQLPTLKTLSLCLPSGTYDEDDEDVNFYPLPPIANGHLPQIRRLSLGGTSTLAGNISSRLTHFSLYDQDHRNRPTINQCLDFLEAKSHL